MHSLRMSVATRPEQLLRTSSTITACYTTDWRGKKRFGVDGGGLVASSLLSLARASDCSAHCVEWIAQRNAKGWDQHAVYVGVRSIEELVQPFVVERRPWARSEVFINEGN